MLGEDENGAVDVAMAEVLNNYDEIEGRIIPQDEVEDLLRTTDKDKILKV